jgi:hypothetical protein
MTQSWFRMDAGGNVVGVSESDLATAEMNLSEGQYLLPADPDVNPRTDVWDKGAERWIHGAVALPRLEDDPLYMRRTGYPTLPEQVGVLMKIATYAVAGVPVPQDVRDEFADLNAQIAAVKTAHPKPKTPPA